MILSPLSEVRLLKMRCMHDRASSFTNEMQFFGRRPIYIGSFTFFLIWLIPCAVARNIQTMLIARFLDGLAGSAFLSVAGGTVGDMFAKHVGECNDQTSIILIWTKELSAPMMVYTASPFIG